MKAIIRGIEIINSGDVGAHIQFDIEIPKIIDVNELYYSDCELLEYYDDEEKSLIRFNVDKFKSADGDEITNRTIVLLQVAYAISIHKAQGFNI